MNFKTFIAPGAAIMLMAAACSDNNGGTGEMGNPALENIMTRSSIRAYTSQSVSPDTLETILRAAMAAPTAVNTQPWKFVVVSSPDKLHALADSLPNAGEKLTSAGAVVLVCGDTTRFFKPQPDFWVQDCSAATENLLLAAHAMGLGAVWCGLYPDLNRIAAVRGILGLGEELIPLSIVPIGYPAVEPEIKDKWKPENIITIAE